MSIFVNRILGFAMGATLLAGAAATASAQQRQFHLPVPARWGEIVLPPGDYQLSQTGISTVRSIFLLRGPAGTSFILPMTVDTNGERSEPLTKNYLQLVRVDGEYFVERYEDGMRSLTFFFRTPKPGRRLQISEDFANIPVSGN